MSELFFSSAVDAKPPLPGPFTPGDVASLTLHGTEPETTGTGKKARTRAAAKVNQDTGCVAKLRDDVALIAVFDGHGVWGDKISKGAARSLHAALDVHPQLRDMPGIALKDAFAAAEAAVQAEPEKAKLSGAVAVCALLVAEPDGTHVLWTAHAGDCRAVLASGGGALQLTQDHKPDAPAEKARIIRAGGFVSPSPPSAKIARVWLDRTMYSPGVAMSRCLGDGIAKTVGVSAEPEVWDGAGEGLE